MTTTAHKPAFKPLSVLTPQSFERMLRKLEGSSQVVEKGNHYVVIEHPVKHYSAQINFMEDIAHIPVHVTFERLVDGKEGTEAVFTSKGGRTYRALVKRIFLYE